MIALALLLACLPTPLPPEVEVATPRLSPRPTCGADLAPTPELVRDAGGTSPMVGVQGQDDLLVGHLHYLREEVTTGDFPVAGAVLFHRGPQGWMATLPQEPENLVGLYTGRSPTGQRELFIVTHGQIEGPHQSFSYWYGVGDLSERRCAVIDFPPAINGAGWMMEYLELVSLDRSPDGRLRLVGSTVADRQAPDLYPYYAWESADLGASWGAPVGLQAPPPPWGGLQAGDHVPMAALEASLRAQVAPPPAP